MVGGAVDAVGTPDLPRRISNSSRDFEKRKGFTKHCLKPVDVEVNTPSTAGEFWRTITVISMTNGAMDLNAILICSLS